MLHWWASSIANVLTGGRFEPVCARVHAWPDSAPRSRFLALMDWWFGPGHCRQVRAVSLLGRMLRG